MKKLILSLFVFSLLLVLVQCTRMPAENRCENAEARTKIISSLVNNHAYTTELMDSVMNSKHGKQMMMDRMMDCCLTDSLMFKNMVGKTMEMCDADLEKCNMISSTLMMHKPAMNCMKTSLKESELKEKNEKEIMDASKK